MTINSTTVLAIDPGYDRLGWAVASISGNKIELQDFGCIQPKKMKGSARLLEVANSVSALISKFKPAELAIEELFFSSNVSTAMKVSEVRGCIIGIAMQSKLKIFNYNPGTIKLAAAGHGKATKADIEKMVRLQLPLPTSELLDDTIDALAILITHQLHRKLDKYQ